LNGIALPAGLQWIDRPQHVDIQQSVSRTLSGAPVVWYQKTSGLQPVTLVADMPYCWFYWEWMDRLEKWQKITGGQFAFQWDSFNATVIFAHHSPPALGLTPRYNLSDETKDRYTGSIKLITI
jgi:hypothetical protein